MLKTKQQDLKNKVVTISGSGNVAQFAAEKIIELGGKVVSLSDSSGTVFDSDGIDSKKLDFIKELKNIKRGRIKEYAEKYNKVEFLQSKNPWAIKCDIALPCATQNEINKEDAELLIKNGCIAVAEGANMPSNRDAVRVFINNKILFAPGKAANAGGVAVSGLEMSQNSMFTSWNRKEVDMKLKNIMHNIHSKCVEYGKEDKGYINYIKGANIAGFIKVADAMLDQGVV